MKTNLCVLLIMVVFSSMGQTTTTTTVYKVTTFDRITRSITKFFGPGRYKDRNFVYSYKYKEEQEVLTEAIVSPDMLLTTNDSTHQTDTLSQTVSLVHMPDTISGWQFLYYDSGICEKNDSLHCGVFSFPDEGPWEIIISSDYLFDANDFVIKLDNVTQSIVIPKSKTKVEVENGLYGERIEYCNFTIMARNLKTGDVCIQ